VRTRVQNRRQFVRMSLGTSAYTIVNGKIVRASIVNISRGGVLLELDGVSQNFPETGDRMAVAVDLPRNPLFCPRSLNCKGVIVRGTGEPGQPSHFAIQFTSIKIRQGSAAFCLRPRRPRVSEAHARIHLVRTSSRSDHKEEGIQSHSQMRHVRA
jgi:hypothetical protein